MAMSYTDPSATIYLLGCGVAAHEIGKSYISTLAIISQRKMAAFDKDVSWSWIGIPGINDYRSSGDLWVASPDGSVKKQ